MAASGLFKLPDPPGMTASPQAKAPLSPDSKSSAVPVAPILAAILPRLSAAEWHMQHALTALPDPAPWHDLALAILGVLRPLHWRADGLRSIEAALDGLHRSGVIHIPGYTPPSDPPPAEPRPGDYRPRCQWCGEPCPSLTAKYCKNSHRQMAYEARRKAKGLTPRPESGTRRSAPKSKAPA